MCIRDRVSTQSTWGKGRFNLAENQAMSASLLWELVKNNNAFLVRRQGVEFSTDPYNLTGKNNFSSCGFIQRNGIAIAPVKAESQKKAVPVNVGYSLTFLKRQRWIRKTRAPTKTEKAGNPKNRQTFRTETLVLHPGRIHAASRVIKKKLQYVRRDLVQPALRRLVAVHRANVNRSKTQRQRKHQTKQKQQVLNFLVVVSHIQRAEYASIYI
eukprot:TRINITY_DN7590_c0_g3_i2.p2 TRINITY_DN7590_c0_g3~~TRINITY_DN7590_c0_g3_i2.p2  ORF type:complete len:212 (-),score=62.67 TRINITY_DN7590_c0_g3_i2:227-862(-)